MVFDPNLIEVTRTIAVTVSSCIIADTAVLVDGVELPVTTDNDLGSGEGVVVDQVSDFAREGEEGEDGARSRVHLCSGGGIMGSERPEQNKQVRKLMVALVK